MFGKDFVTNSTLAHIFLLVSNSVIYATGIGDASCLNLQLHVAACTQYF